MTYLPSLPEGAVLLDVFRAYPETARPLLDYHQALMRGSSPRGAQIIYSAAGGLQSGRPRTTAWIWMRATCAASWAGGDGSGV